MSSHTQTPKPVTIKDVAKLAGVSPSTVSRVLNNLDRVSDKTRALVNDAIQKLSYSQNKIAVSMVTGQTKTIMIVTPSITTDYIFRTLQILEEVLYSHGYFSIIFTTTKAEGQDPAIYLNKYIQMIDGAIVFCIEQHTWNLNSFSKPLVVIGPTREDSSLNTVYADEHDGCYQLTRRLIQNNHRRIGFISERPGSYARYNQFSGFCQAMAESGIPVKNDYVLMDVNEWCSEYEAYYNTRKLLSLPLPPTAILAGTERICLGSIRCMMDLNLTIGKDISLVSYTDPMPQHPIITPGITAAFVPWADIAASAANRLVELLTASGDSAPVQKIFATRICDRSSIKRL